MVDTGTKVPLGATPGKIGLVVVLSIVLIVVLISSSTSDESSRITPRSRHATSSSQVNLPAAPMESVKSKLITQQSSMSLSTASIQRWKAITLDVALQHDPFAAPAIFLPKLRLRDQAHKSTARATAALPDEQQREVARADAAAREQALNALEKNGVSMILQSDDQWLAVIGDATVRVGDELNSFRVVEIRPDGIVLEHLPHQR